ncbi:hypothetical protein BDBG_06110 [Blastomyces gilchristii SLH14081]|uniref:Uncharacterized protein n=1 Tax=Blastomyces gilchristii (strain SLH14081) TaxID=559298 RepID=A0A179UVA8_BLAGS|nr:uncharacterized protein BDBG_06110 [Blastomyces gilchristii SLH14081]OAT11159.1 hypothetical protein BDBG_06110 [Blastomyces gilchristii SLH14081]
MSSPLICRSWLPPQPRLCRYASSSLPPRLVTFDKLLRHIRRSTPRPEPSASQLLRYALTGTLKTSSNRYFSETLEGYMLEAFSNPDLPETWTIFNTDPSKRKSLNRHFTVVDRIDPKYLMVPTELPKFEAICEKYIFSPQVAREYWRSDDAIIGPLTYSGKSEDLARVLSTVNALVARFTLLKVRVPKQLHILGMHAAAQHFSAPALRSYLHSYVAAGHGPLPRNSARRLLRYLYLSCQMSIFESPMIDLGPMRELVTGLDEYGSAIQPNLFSLLSMSGYVRLRYIYSYYFQLLGIIGGSRRLLDIWPTVRDRFTESPSDRHVRTFVTSYLAALLRSGFGYEAAYFAEQLSAISNLNDFLPASMWKQLLEQENSEGLLKLVSSQTMNVIMVEALTSMETSLGITWDPDGGGRHLKTTDTDPWWDQWPADAMLPSLDSDSNKSGSLGCIKRLFREIELYGSSRSTKELARVANLLHDFEGIEVPLGSTKDYLGQVHEFAWLPQCCPIEFSNNVPPSPYNIAGPQTPSSLGLIRAFHDIDGKPIPLSMRKLYLMQLGYVCERRRGSAEGGVNSTTGDISKWRDTGHIICWDRLHERLIMIFLGKGWGTIDPGLYPKNSHLLLPSVATLRLKLSPDFQSEFSEYSGAISPMETRYWLDVDPAAYLDS